MPHSVAIIGSGPGGFYCAGALCKKMGDIRVDILDRLPTPFGLVRSGVAPDHQGTKNVMRIFDKTMQRPHVRFLGNVEVGRDVSLAELRGMYDAVVLAVGAPNDRRLGIPGEELEGVVGAAELTGWYNAHPDHIGRGLRFEHGDVAVIGNGNVALDVGRVLSKSRAEFAKSDLPEAVFANISAGNFQQIHILGRRGPVEAKFTPTELREMGELEKVVALARPEQVPDEMTLQLDDRRAQRDKEKNLAIFQSFTKNEVDATKGRINFEFYASPEAILGETRVEGIRMARTKIVDGRVVKTGETFDLAVGTVVTCIGFQPSPLADLSLSSWGTSFENDEGLIGDGLWVVGWAKRGPSGTIGDNRPDSAQVAHRLLTTLSGEGKPGPASLDAHLQARSVSPISYERWCRIDAAEKAAAPEGRPRKKLTTIEALVEAAG